MLSSLTNMIVELESQTGQWVFIGLSLLITIVLCFVAIPLTTDLMVNHAAGLAGRWFGPKFRTLVINASTNNPELAAMAVSLGMRRLGGWANPLGSLGANCYLMFLVAPIWLVLTDLVRGRADNVKRLVTLIRTEKRLVFWHVGMALFAVVCGNGALWLMRTHSTEVAPEPIRDAVSSAAGQSVLTPPTDWTMYVALGVLVAGVLIMLLLEAGLKRRRPNLYTDIHDANHGHSLILFGVGTVGLIVSCWLMNALFLAWTELYGEHLGRVLGTAVFAGLHYVLGALITSLPELRVALGNYRRLTVPDLNTALGSASYSNLTNLAICLLGLALFAGLTWSGVSMPW
ncbi:MAG: hypothetical protein D8M59_06220 [Planctomycetes bacterium]|nr:hypothetical protein [Planctomycetota bacterium]NOG55092.1 hypothetical protein [Planctomycetota bacterium]